MRSTLQQDSNLRQALCLAPRRYGQNLGVLYMLAADATVEEIRQAWDSGEEFLCPKLRRTISRYTVPPGVDLLMAYTAAFPRAGLTIDLRRSDSE